MANYTRAWQPGGTWFFTVTCLGRYDNDLRVKNIGILRRSVGTVKRSYPFAIHAWVVLPDHLHCVISLPEGDTDFATRWRLIKAGFSKGLPEREWVSDTRRRRGERGVWQRRYWEHLIRDDADFQAHVDYCHINPLKHGLVERVGDWPYSTFHRMVEQGVYPGDWAGGAEGAVTCSD